MTTENMTWNNVAVTQYVDSDRWDLFGGRYRIRLMVSKDEDGRYSAVALNLPGAGSDGDTFDEAITNAKEAVSTAIECYKEDGDEIPWREVEDCDMPPDAILKWVMVNA